MSNVPLPHMRGVLLRDLKPGTIYLCLVSGRRWLVRDVRERGGTADDGAAVSIWEAECFGWNHVTGQYETLMAVDHQLCEIPIPPRKPTVDAGTARSETPAPIPQP